MSDEQPDNYEMIYGAVEVRLTNTGYDGNAMWLIVTLHVLIYCCVLVFVCVCDRG